MRAVDTDIIVRYLTGDDPRQAAKARVLHGHEPVFAPRTVLLKAEWVLRRVYDFPATRIVPALRALAGLPGITFQDACLVAQAMTWTEGGMDLADALHLAGAADSDGFVTFDKRFIRIAAGLGGVSVTIS